MKNRVYIDLPEALKKALKIRAIQEGKALKKLIEEMLSEKLNKK